MNEIEIYLTIEISNLKHELLGAWKNLTNEVQCKNLTNEVQCKKLRNIEPFLITIRELEARISHLDILIERANDRCDHCNNPFNGSEEYYVAIPGLKDDIGFDVYKNICDKCYKELISDL